MKSIGKVLDIGVAFFLFIICGFSILRLFLGVDISDEAYYLAVPYSFTFGNLPFLDEFQVQQTCGFVLYPLIRLYTFLVGSTEGIVVVFRFIYLIFAGFAVFVVFRFSRDYLKKSILGLLAGSIIFIFTPFTIYTSSYNSMSYQFLTIGSLGFLISLSLKKNRQLVSYLSGFVLALTVVAYPTSAIVIFPFLIWSFFHAKQSKKLENFWYFGLGAGTPLALFLGVILFVGVRETLDAVRTHVSLGIAVGGLQKLRDMFHHLFPAHRKIIFVLFALYVFVTQFLARRHLKLLLGLVFVLSSIMAYFSVDAPYPAHDLINRWAYLFIPLFMRKECLSKKLMPITFLFFLSFFYGLVMGWTSSGDIFAVTNGWVICVMLGVFLLFFEIEAKLQEKWVPLVTAFGVVVLFAFHFYQQFYNVYRDSPIPKLNSQIKSGPYKWIFTSEYKINFLEQLKSDSDLYAQLGRTVFFYDRFPGGYLFSKSRPLAYSIMVPAGPNYPKLRPKLIADYEKRGAVPDVIFEMKRIVHTERVIEDVSLPETDLLKAYFTSKGYTRLKETGFYIVYGRKGI